MFYVSHASSLVRGAASTLLEVVTAAVIKNGFFFLKQGVPPLSPPPPANDLMCLRALKAFIQLSNNEE